MNEQVVNPWRVYVWSGLLFGIALLGNVSAPWLLSYGSDLVRTSRDTWVSSYAYRVLGAACMGLWLSQYAALFVWLNAYVANDARRRMFGLFCNLAISFTFVFGITMVVRTAPIFMFVNYFLGGIAIYVILAGVLGTLLRRSDIHWRTRSPERKSQYSIRAILAAMVGAAVLMLALKWFPTDIMNNRPNGKIMMLVTPAIWIVWLAVAIAVLIWLQLASVFHTQRRRFWTLLLITMALGPLLFLWVGRWIWIWLPNAPSKLFSIQTLWAYAIELGLVLGVAIVIRLLPPPKGFEPLAGGKRSATSGPEHA